MDKERSKILFTLFNNRLKSNYIPWDAKDKEKEAQESNELRKRRAETIAKIVKARMGASSSLIILGDMNDTEKSEWIEPFTKDPELRLTNALLNATETHPAKPDDPPPPTTIWTHRYKPSGQSAEYLLYDQIWLSQPLADKLRETKIDRRTKHSGDGSDHDPAWITLEI
jgi:exonuclease III